MHRDVGSREKLALLVGTLIHGVRQEIRPDTAVVEQRVAFARRSVADDSATLPSRLYQELEEPALRVLHALLKGRVVVRAPQAGGFLRCRELAHPRRHRLRGVLHMPGIEARSEEHTSELQSHSDLVCRLLLEKKK